MRDLTATRTGRRVAVQILGTEAATTAMRTHLSALFRAVCLRDKDSFSPGPGSVTFFHNTLAKRLAWC